MESKFMQQVQRVKKMHTPELDSIVDQLISEQVAKLNTYREMQIVAAIKAQGYEFKNRAELETFCRDRCRLEYHPGNITRLYIDEIILACEWVFDPQIKYDGNEVTITI